MHLWRGQCVAGFLLEDGLFIRLKVKIESEEQKAF
jgi:hypothetical protein